MSVKLTILAVRHSSSLRDRKTSSLRSRLGKLQVCWASKGSYSPLSRCYAKFTRPRYPLQCSSARELPCCDASILLARCTLSDAHTHLSQRICGLMRIPLWNRAAAQWAQVNYPTSMNTQLVPTLCLGQSPWLHANRRDESAWHACRSFTHLRCHSAASS
jgi:hypothetical protein